MSFESSIAAIILAAGESSRMGTPKALLHFQGRTFLGGLIAKLQNHCDPIIVVLGHNPEPIRAATPCAARFVLNPDYRQGMLTSLQCGLEAVPETSTHVIFTLVDHPNPANETIAAVCGAGFSRPSPEAPVVIPRYRAKKGHPVRLSRAVMDELLALPPAAKATDVLYRHLDATRFLDLDDPGIVDDIDDRGAYEELLERAGSS